MENIKEIIAKNLVELRKSHKMTQQALADKLNYTDKAVSRWEHAETLPDIETLCKICDIYGVKFEYLLQKEQPDNPKNNPHLKKSDMGVKIAITLISACTVWLSAILLYTLMWSKEPWTVFIWALPLTSLVTYFCNYYFWGSKIFRMIAESIFIWTFILGVYVEMILRYESHIWMLFILGIPIQAIIIISETLIKSSKRR